MRTFFNAATYWVRSLKQLYFDQVDCLRIVGREVASLSKAKHFILRIFDFITAMCNGGIVVPDKLPGSESHQNDDHSTEIRAHTAAVMRSFIQPDGDIVFRLSPEFKHLPPTRQTEALMRHFEDVSRALDPIHELRALTVASTTLLRTAAAAVIACVELIPYLSGLVAPHRRWPVSFDGLQIVSHGLSAAVLILAIVIPMLLRCAGKSIVKRKLIHFVGIEWENDTPFYEKMLEAENGSGKQAD